MEKQRGEGRGLSPRGSVLGETLVISNFALGKDEAQDSQSRASLEGQLEVEEVVEGGKRAEPERGPEEGETGSFNPIGKGEGG